MTEDQKTIEEIVERMFEIRHRIRERFMERFPHGGLQERTRWRAITRRLGIHAAHGHGWGTAEIMNADMRWLELMDKQFA